MNEIWRNVIGYEGLYEVSNWGRVRSLDHYVNDKGGTRLVKGRILKPMSNGCGYLFVSLCKDGVMKKHKVHRLVGMAFPDMVDWIEKAKGKPFDELLINHKDENPLNNSVNNLEWCDKAYNTRYSLAKTVYMYTEDDKLCGMWSSIIECDRNGFNKAHICECCNGKLKKHKGYKWSYEPPKPPKALPYYVT